MWLQDLTVKNDGLLQVFSECFPLCFCLFLHFTPVSFPDHHGGTDKELQPEFSLLRKLSFGPHYTKHLKSKGISCSKPGCMNRSTAGDYSCIRISMTVQKVIKIAGGSFVKPLESRVNDLGPLSIVKQRG